VQRGCVIPYDAHIGWTVKHPVQRHENSQNQRRIGSRMAFGPYAAKSTRLVKSSTGYAISSYGIARDAVTAVPAAPTCVVDRACPLARSQSAFAGVRQALFDFICRSQIGSPSANRWSAAVAADVAGARTTTTAASALTIAPRLWAGWNMLTDLLGWHC